MAKTRIDDQLGERFVCAKCHAEGGAARRIATTGTGFSRVFDIQHNKFIAVSCRKCGFTELYAPDILEESGTATDNLDEIFGS